MLFTFRLVVFTEDFLLTSYLIQASVTSHARPTFQDIDIFPSFPLAYPDFAVVPLGTRNVCSGEAFEQVIQCDWKIVENAGNDSFILQDFHDCIRMGITHHENDNSYRFLALSPNHPISEAYLISPIIEGGSSHFILSFYYIPRCNKTSIRAYIVPSYKYLQNSVSQFKQLVYEKHHNKSDTNWFFVFKSIETLQNYDFFQVKLLKEYICPSAKGLISKSNHFLFYWYLLKRRGKQTGATKRTTNVDLVGSPRCWAMFVL